MHKNSYLKMKWFKDSYLNKTSHLNILDVGSLDNNENNYRKIFDEYNWTYTGLDIKNGNNVDIVISDIYNWFEIEDDKFDVIISGQFFEHLEFFWLTMGQIERTLKPGGYVCIIVPSSGLKHDGNMLNCYRFHEDGLRALAKYADLEIDHISVDNRPEANPWNDACLIAHKKGNPKLDTQDLEAKIKQLESKLDMALEKK